MVNYVNDSSTPTADHATSPDQVSAGASGAIAIDQRRQQLKAPSLRERPGGTLGPAFVASVAYMDPGNFATNIEGGARFGYRTAVGAAVVERHGDSGAVSGGEAGNFHGQTLPENCRAEFSRPVTCVCGLRRKSRRWRRISLNFWRGAGVLFAVWNSDVARGNSDRRCA